MRRFVVFVGSIGVGLALSPLLIPIPSEVRLIGMAVVFGFVGAVMLVDVHHRRRM